MSGKFQPVKPSNRGKLTRKAHAAGESVSQFARQHYHDSGRTGKEARFAVIAKGWRHGGRHKRRTGRK